MLRDAFSSCAIPPLPTLPQMTASQPIQPYSRYRYIASLHALFLRTWLILAWLILSATIGPISCATAAGELSSAKSFQIGEQLTYEISWLNITAGTAVMAVGAAGTDGERPLVKLVTTAQSRPAITKFFPVDNRVESIVDPATLLPEHMTFKRREGKKKEDIEYTFHQKEGTVTAVKGGTTETLQIPPGTLDAISCLYYARSQLSLLPGSLLRMNVYHDKKNRKLDVRVEEIETVSGPWGEVETARVLVVMPFQGIFLNRGNIRVWFTNDDRRIPVRMKAKVIIGSIVADLVSGLQASSSIQ
ncbi:MAG TPA: DUF3108 domain-containing protein [Nitrospiraceae bacterium]